MGAVGCFAYLGLFYQQQMLPSGSVQHKCAWNGHNCKLFIFCYLHILMGKLTLILKEEVFSTTSTPCGCNAVYLLNLRRVRVRGACMPRLPLFSPLKWRSPNHPSNYIIMAPLIKKTSIGDQNTKENYHFFRVNFYLCHKFSTKKKIQKLIFKNSQLNFYWKNFFSLQTCSLGNMQLLYNQV